MLMFVNSFGFSAGGWGKFMRLTNAWWETPPRPFLYTSSVPSAAGPAAGPAVILSREAQRLKLFDSLLKDVEVHFFGSR